MSCKSFKELSSVEKQELLHKPNVAAATALNINGVSYEGEPVTITSYENGVVKMLDKDNKEIIVFADENKLVSYDGKIINLEALDELYSDMDYMKDTAGTFDTLAVGLVNDPVKMIEIAYTVDKYMPEVDPVHKANLLGTLKQAVDPLKQAIPEITIALNAEANRNQGSIAIDRANMTVDMQISIGPGRSNMSPLEIYTHEVLHAATGFVLKANGAKYAGVRNEVTRIRKTLFETKDVVSRLSKHTTKEHAEDILDYLSDPKTGLAEFIAYSQTHKPVMEVLKELNTKKEKVEYESLSAWLAGTIHKMFNMLRNRLAGMPIDNDYARMTFLVDKLIRANNRQLEMKREGIFGKLFGQFSKVDDKVGEVIQRELEKRSKDYELLDSSDMTRFDQARYVMKTVGKSFYNDKARNMVAAELSYFNMDERGSVQSAVAEILGGDEITDYAEGIGQQAGDLNRRREVQRGISKTELRNAFDDKLTDNNKEGINVLLDADLIALSEDYKISELVHPISGKGNTEKAVSKLEQKLGNKYSPALVNYYKFQSMLLARYMVDETGAMTLLKNPTAIARRVGTVNEIKKADAETIKIVDELTSLYALELIDVSKKNNLYAAITKDPKGTSVVAYYAEYNKRFAKDNLFKGTGVLQEIKGYRTANIPQDVETTVRPISEEKELKAQGFRLAFETNNHSVDSAQKLGFYVSELPLRTKWHRGAFQPKSTKHRGTSLREGHYLTDGKNGKLKGDTDVNRAMIQSYKIIDQVMAGTYKESKEDRMLSPRLDSQGSIIDYDYQMDKKTKAKYMNTSNDPIETLANVRASNYDKVEVPKHNDKVFDLIEKEMKENYRKGDLLLDKKIGKNNKNYLWVGDDSSDPEIRALWRMLPDPVRSRFTEIIDEKEVKGFAVRADLYHTLLGYQEFAVSDTDWSKKNLPLNIRRVMRIAGKIWKDIIRIFKGNILLKIPVVLIHNIMSNLAFSIFYKMDPLKVMKYQSRGVAELNRFIKDTQEMVHLQTLDKVDKLDREGKRRLNLLTNELEHSDIKQLVDEGFYTQILEEAEADEESGNLVKDFANKKLEGTPSLIRNGLDWMWLSDSNSVVKFMNSATQYSDFVARYAHYNMMREKGKTHNESITQVRSMFVNYSKPSSPFIEWSNQMGIVMFTKYFTRIQKAITQFAKGHPLMAMVVLLGQEALLDVPDVYDAHLFSKDIGNMFYDPLDSIVGAATPGAYLFTKDIM